MGTLEQYDRIPDTIPLEFFLSSYFNPKIYTNTQYS